MLNNDRKGLLLWFKYDENEWNAVVVFNKSIEKQSDETQTKDIQSDDEAVPHGVRIDEAAPHGAILAKKVKRRRAATTALPAISRELKGSAGQLLPSDTSGKSLMNARKVETPAGINKMQPGNFARLREHATGTGISDYCPSPECLTTNELEVMISSTTVVSESLGNPDTSFKTYFNSDKTFHVETIKNGKIDNVSTGFYEVVDKEGLGYIRMMYNNDVTPSKDSDSFYSLENQNSILKTNLLLSGPFQLFNDNNYGKVYWYNTPENKVLTLTIFRQ
jgi:hypothetical protein